MGYIEDAGEDTVKFKKAVRKKVLALRDSIPAEDRARYDASIRKIVTGLEEYREAEAILAYVSYKSEVDTTMLIQQALKDGKHVFAPKVTGNEMEFWQILSLEDLKEGYRGILEPKQSITFPDWVSERRNIASIDAVIDKVEGCAPEGCKVMMLMPGVVFDRQRHRIGYGGGFYDRYLDRLSQLSKKTDFAEQTRTNLDHITLTTAALAYSCQVLEQIPYEEHDVKPDVLVTEQGIC